MAKHQEDPLVNNPGLFHTPLASCAATEVREESTPLLMSHPTILLPHLPTGWDAGDTAQLTLVKATLPVIIQCQLLHRTEDCGGVGGVPTLNDKHRLAHAVLWAQPARDGHL